MAPPLGWLPIGGWSLPPRHPPPIDLLWVRVVPQHVHRPEGEDHTPRTPRQLGQAGHGARGVAGLEPEVDAVGPLCMVWASEEKGQSIGAPVCVWTTATDMGGTTRSAARSKSMPHIPAPWA